MARVTVRIDDETYDRLALRALRTGKTLSDVIRPAMRRLADPGRADELEPQDAQLALTTYVASLIVLDARVRTPDLPEKALATARELFLRWGMPQVICDLAIAELESVHDR